MFEECQSKEDAKSLFRKLCHLLHPDKGGSHELMSLLNRCYEKKNSSFSKKFTDRKEKYTSDESFSKKESGSENRIMAGDERLKIFDEMFEYMETHSERDMNCAFLCDLQVFLEKKGYITVKQYEALKDWFKIWKTGTR